MKTPVRPVLVPCLSGYHLNGNLFPPQGNSLPCPVTLTADRGTGTPYPAHRLRLTFHRGQELGSNPIEMAFDCPDDLLPVKSSRTAGGLDPDEVNDVRARYWDLCTGGTRMAKMWDSAQMASGLPPRSGRTPYGNFRVHLYDALSPTVKFLRAENPIDLFLPAISDIPASLLKWARRFHSSRGSACGWIVERTPSAHAQITALNNLATWLDWLAPTQGWKLPFAPPVAIRTIAG